MKNTFRFLFLVFCLLTIVDPLHAQWIQTNGPYGGQVHCLAASGTNVFAAIDSGVFLSTNNGTSWTAVNAGLTKKNVWCLAVSGSNLFAGTYGEGVFLSTNNGTSWTAASTGLTNTTVIALAVSGTNLFAGTSGGTNGAVFLSTNNGTSWTAVSTGLPNAAVDAFAVSPNGAGGTNLFAGTRGSGVFLSTDDGSSWTAVNTGLPQYAIVQALAVSGTNLFAGTSLGVFLSTNNGTSWTEVQAGLTAYDVSSLAFSGTNLFAGTDNGNIFLSTNNGTSWAEVHAGSEYTTVNALVVSGTNLFAGTSVGVFLSTNNGTTWTTVNTGLTYTPVSALAVSGTNIFAGTSVGVFLSTNNGTSWTAVNTGLTSTSIGALAVSPASGGSGTNLFAGVDGGVFLSTNNGTSWTAVGLEGTAVFTLAVSPASSGSGSNLFAGAYFGYVFLSSNNGTSWTGAAVPTGLTTIAVRSLIISGTNLFAGTSGGVFLSTNNGTSWTAVGLTNTTVNGLAVSGTNLFAGTNGGVFLSANNGTSWTAVNTGLTNTTVNALAVSGTNLFAGTNGGVFLSTNNGTSWSAVNYGLTNMPVYAFAVCGTNLFVGTAGGVSRRPLSEMITSTVTAQEFPIAVGNDNTFCVGAAFDGTNYLVGIQGDLVSSNSVTAQLVSASGALVAPRISLGVSGGGPLVAFDKSNYLVVWSDNANNVYGQFINTSGKLMGAAFMIAANATIGERGGRIAFGDTTYMVVWVRDEILYGQRVGKSGNLIGAATQITSYKAREDAIAFDGTNYLVVWCDRLSNDKDIYGQFISKSGVLVGSNFLIDDGPNLSDNPVSVAFDGSRYMVGFHDQSGTPHTWNLFARFVTPSGAVAEKITLRDSTYNPIFPMIAFDGTNYLVTWGEGVLTSGAQSKGMFFSTSGVPVGPAFTIFDTLGGKVPFYTGAIFGGNQYLAFTTRVRLSLDAGGQFSYTDGDVYGTVVRPLTTGGAVSLTQSVVTISPSKVVSRSTAIITLQAKDGAGNNLTTGGLVVAFSLTGGGTSSGTIGSVKDNGNGTYTATFTGTTAGTARTVSATIGGSPVTSTLPTITVTAAAPPTITSFTPSSGPIGTSVTITGTNFSTIAANNIVFFGATKATVTGASTTQLTVTVPAGATYQPITVTVGGLTAYSSQPFIVTFPTVATITSASFASKVDFATGLNPRGVAISDIDGDGKPDLVVTDQNGHAASVFRNTSLSGSMTSGSFDTKVDLYSGAVPLDVAIGDIDGDGKPDLVVVNYSSNTVSVFRNTSSSGSITSGSFAAAINVATGSAPYDVAISDIDGDGKPDLVVPNLLSGTVSVFRNTSSSAGISFAEKVDFTPGTGPYHVAVCDIDGDRKPDLVVTSSGSNTVSVFKNTSTTGSITTGSFAARVDFTAGPYPHDVAIGDIDGDGKPDLVVSNNGGSTVSVFRNTSTSAGISFAVKIDFETGLYPGGVAIGDIDGDGKPDLAVTNGASNTVSVFRNTSSSGSVSFAANVDFATGTSSSGVAIGDIDGDGKPDLVVTNWTSNTVSVFQNMTQSPLAQSPTLSSINPSTAIKGSDFNIEIRVGDSTRAANVFGVGFDLHYTNTSYIDYVSTDMSSCFLGGDLLYLVTPDDANGKVSVGLSRKAPLSGVSGGGTLIRLKFHVASTAPDTGTVTFSFANVTANDQNGKSITLLPVSGTTKIQGFSVWPGDADNNGVVNQSDILPLGLYWGSTGPARSNPSQQWIAQSATVWTPQAATYADANGDGVVNQADVLPIGLNWGKTHSLGKVGSSVASGQMPTQASVQGTPVLRATGPASVRGKTTFDVTVTLGDTVNPVSGLFGISFVLDFASSKSIIQATEVTPGTFLGSDIIFFPQIDTTNGLVAVGMTRKSGASDVAGFGQVAKIKFQVVNNTSASSIVFTTRDITANDAGGNSVVVQPSSSSILVSVDEGNSVPVGFRLEQNYPNPFNPSTTISFSLPSKSLVLLKVFDLLGREVTTIVSEELSAGNYSRQWNATGIPSGVYFYRLQAGSSVEVRRLVLLR